ncbi:MAG: glycosyltransferase family 2 protein [Prochlorotrichaceae cyanobacterium]|jgi:GT2 family glycosyltransferase
MPEPRVTLIVVPRERFSYSKQSLESIYSNTHYPFHLIYVDGNSPDPLRGYLKKQAQERGFQLIRTDYYLSPNQARNLAIVEAKTEYVVFVDNDVLVTPGWLETAVNSADQQAASVIVPLTLEGEAFDTVHQIGGEIVLRDLKDGRHWIIERRPFMHLPLSKCSHKLKRSETQLSEFHCVLVRRDIFDHTGLLDEKLMSLAEETDFCLSVLNSGGKIYTEPNCVISYVPPFSLEWYDLPFFFLRWSDHWAKTSVERMMEKYLLSSDSPTIKNYRYFVYSHRQLAFGNNNETRFKELLFTKDLSISGKIIYFFKKLMRKRMNRYATNT